MTELAIEPEINSKELDSNEFSEAIESNNIDVVKSILKLITMKLLDGDTLLYKYYNYIREGLIDACTIGNYEIIKLLIDYIHDHKSIYLDKWLDELPERFKELIQIFPGGICNYISDLGILQLAIKSGNPKIIEIIFENTRLLPNDYYTTKGGIIDIIYPLNKDIICLMIEKKYGKDYFKLEENWNSNITEGMFQGRIKESLEIKLRYHIISEDTMKVKQYLTDLFTNPMLDQTINKYVPFIRTACQMGNYEIVDHLINLLRKANLKFQTCNYLGFLGYAYHGGNIKVMHRFLNMASLEDFKKVMINTPSKLRYIFGGACRSGNLKLVMIAEEYLDILEQNSYYSASKHIGNKLIPNESNKVTKSDAIFDGLRYALFENHLLIARYLFEKYINNKYCDRLNKNQVKRLIEYRDKELDKIDAYVINNGYYIKDICGIVREYIKERY